VRDLLPEPKVQASRRPLIPVGLTVGEEQCELERLRQRGLRRLTRLPQCCRARAAARRRRVGACAASVGRCRVRSARQRFYGSSTSEHVSLRDESPQRRGAGDAGRFSRSAPSLHHMLIRNLSGMSDPRNQAKSF